MFIQRITSVEFAKLLMLEEGDLMRILSAVPIPLMSRGLRLGQALMQSNV